MMSCPIVTARADATSAPGADVAVGHIRQRIARSVFRQLDEAEVEIGKLPPADCPVTHRFTPGLYIREIFMPAGTALTSKIHCTEHPYVISRGVVSVFTEADGAKLLSAPYFGITKPGTRRLLYIHEDTIWTTFHPTDLTDVAAIEEAIIMKHINPLLDTTKEDALCPG